MALTLAIEISNPSAPEPDHRRLGFGMGVAIGDGGALVDRELLRESERHDDDLMPAIDRLFRRAGRRPREIARVAVSVGPGGYTALRIAIATAKMLCEATGAACIPVPTAMAVARRSGGPFPFAVALASKGDAAWVSKIEDAGGGWNGSIMTEAGIESLGVSLLVVDRFVPPRMREEAERLGVRIERPLFDASAVLELSAVLPEIDPLRLVPLYPREAEAVTQWRKRRAK